MMLYLLPSPLQANGYGLPIMEGLYGMKVMAVPPTGMDIYTWQEQQNRPPVSQAQDVSSKHTEEGRMMVSWQNSIILDRDYGQPITGVS